MKMKSFLWLIGLILMMYLLNSENDHISVICHKNTENKVFLSNSSLPLLTGIDNSENSFSFCSRDFRLTFQKRNISQYHFTTAKFPRPKLTSIRKEYSTCKSKNLFLIYQFSLSLWKVLRQWDP